MLAVVVGEDPAPSQCRGQAQAAVLLHGPASLCPAAAVKAQVQWCGEDQDHRQHVYGRCRAQHPLGA